MLVLRMYSPWKKNGGNSATNLMTTDTGTGPLRRDRRTLLFLVGDEHVCGILTDDSCCCCCCCCFYCWPPPPPPPPMSCPSRALAAKLGRNQFEWMQGFGSIYRMDWFRNPRYVVAVARTAQLFTVGRDEANVRATIVFGYDFDCVFNSAMVKNDRTCIKCIFRNFLCVTVQFEWTTAMSIAYGGCAGTRFLNFSFQM